jgi:hypothetical protein
LDHERKSKRHLEDRLDELESTLQQLVDENQKLKDELSDCISDNKILTQHWQQVQDQQKMNEPYMSEVEEKNVKLNLEVFTLREEMKLLVEDKATLARKNA